MSNCLDNFHGNWHDNSVKSATWHEQCMDICEVSHWELKVGVAQSTSLV